VIVEITGEVKVLLVRVSEPVRDTKSSPDSAELNSARVPETVLLVRLTVLLVKVVVLEAVTVISLVKATVPVLVGRVKVPELTMVAMTGDVKVLFVNVSVVALPTRVSVEVGKVKVPVLLILEIIGDVKVLLVRVSVVVLPTRVSVATGRVSTEAPAVAPETIVVVPEVEPESFTPVVPKVGKVLNTITPVPDSSLTMLAKSAEEPTGS